MTCSLDNPSISRLHALIVHHQRLQAFFLIDCGSAHGTYLAGKRVEPKVPVRIAEGNTPSQHMKFGGSSRVYVLQTLALDGYAVCLLYWYKRTNSDAAGEQM